MNLEPSSAKPLPETGELVRLVEWEIKRLEDAKKEQGWSPWMLFVALAGLLWKMVDELPQSHAWANVALYWGAFTLLINFGSDLHRVLMSRPREKKPGSPPRFFSANRLLGGTRPYLLFVALKVTGAAIIVFCSPLLAGWPKAIWALLFGFHFVGWFLMLTLTFFDVPMAVSTDRANVAVRGSVFIAYVLNTAAMVFLCRQAWPMLTQPFSPADLKLALMLFAAAEIISLLLSHHVVNPIRDNLVQLRRALGLGELTADDCKSRLDLTLHGAEISQYLQPRVQIFLSILNDVTREQDAVARGIAAALEKAQGEASPALASALRAEVDQMKRHVNAVTRLLAQAVEASDAFNLRVMAVAATDERIEGEVRPLRDSMKQQIATATEKSKKLEDEFARLAEACAKLAPPPEPTLPLLI